MEPFLFHLLYSSGSIYLDFLFSVPKSNVLFLLTQLKSIFWFYFLNSFMNFLYPINTACNCFN